MSGQKDQEAAAVWVPVTELHPWDRNPRLNEPAVAKVADSIKRFGFGAPLLARPNGELIAGHTRLKAALKLGLDRVPVRYLDLDPADARLLALADNKLAEIAEWDETLLADILKEVDPGDAALAGFGAKEVADLLEQLAPPEDAGFDDNVPELPAEPVTKPGDLWLLGPHRLLCGDAADPADAGRLVAGDQVRLMLTSPPYGVGLAYDTYEDSIANLRQLLPEVARVWWDLAEPGSFFVVNFGDIVVGREAAGVDEVCEYPTSIEYWPAFRDAGWLLHTRRIWAKPHARVAAPWTASSNRAATDFEHLWTWWKPGKALNERREPSYLGIWDRSRGEGVEIGKDEHPAGFPLVLPTWMLRIYSNPGDVVVDMFGGTGTTLIAAERESRQARLMELSPAYCDVIVQRWEKLTGKKAELPRS